MAPRNANVVITGFMGTGKSTVGRGVARRLKKRFVDMDTMIVARAGMSIPDIFRVQGEDAFRRHERALCAELGQQDGLVIATGGGTLVNEERMALLAPSGYLVCLDCDLAELEHRVGDDDGRPMLWAEDQRRQLRDLLAKRGPAYARIPHHIDTTYRTPAQVIDDIVALVEAAPTTWHVDSPTGEYQVQIMPDGLSHIAALLKARSVSSPIAVVSDENVWPCYGERLTKSLSHAYETVSVVLPAGEQFKTLETLRTLYDRFAEGNLTRASAVVAVGGGVITDMTGFAAATFMRGVPFCQVPTSLLSMVDASIGGKVAVDHPRGKNLIGAFARPMFVMLDPLTLGTLPDIERRSGLAEIIKAGIIADPELFVAYEPDGPGCSLRWAVERAIQVKIDVVQEDPYEHGRRAVLNLGHTFAHAFEVLAGYTLHHGLAVSIGNAAAAHLAELRGLCSAETRRRIIATLVHNGLPVTYDAQSPESIYEAMGSDKKKRGSRLRFILPRDIGDVIIDDEVPREQVVDALERIRS